MKKKLRVIISLCLLLTVIPPIIIYERGFYTIWNQGDIERINAKKTFDLIQSTDLHILDVREKKEFQVSHLANAIIYSPEILEELNPQQPILVYCTASVRSNQLAKELNRRGFKEVYELKGGLLHWKNQGFDLVDRNLNPTDSLHTYNEWLAHFLRNGVAVY